MSRGHGKWERLIMQTLDWREAFYLLELFPPGLAPWEHRSDLRIRALRRAARNLGNAGKVHRFYDSRDRQRRLVIARRGVGVETLRRCLPRMSDRGRIELDLRLRDEESAASLTETNNELYLEPYHQWLNEHGLTDDQEAYEEWLDEQRSSPSPATSQQRTVSRTTSPKKAWPGHEGYRAAAVEIVDAADRAQQGGR